MFIVVATSAKYPELMLMLSNVMSQWGKPKGFPTKDAAREAAAEWAGVFQSEDRRIVVRKVDPGTAVPFPEIQGAPRKRVIIAPPRPSLVEESPRRTIIRRK